MSRDTTLPADAGPGAATADRGSGRAGPDAASPSAGIDGVLIDRIADWLMSSALGEAGVDAIFEGCCQRPHAAGVPPLETCLGPDAGARVLDGQIRRGDGERIHAVIWYSDMCDSTEPVEVFAPC